jgi:hypothetical protein
MSIDHEARAKERGAIGWNLQQQITRVIGEAVCQRPELRTLKLSGGSIEWTEVHERVEYQLAIYLDTRVDTIHYDDPEPEDA